MDFNVVKKVSKVLNSINCRWAIGGSVLLNQYNLIEEPNDIDILIDPDYSEKIKKEMNKIGSYIELESKEPFLTKEFFGYLVDNTVIEFLGGFSIDLGYNKIYSYILDEESIDKKKNIEGVIVNFASLEDWAVAYTIMNDPKNRMPILNNYFSNNGIKNTKLVERYLDKDLPEKTKQKIKEIIK